MILLLPLECLYASNSQMNIGAKPAMFGSTDLLIRESIVDEWIKVPLVNMTFIAATVTYKKKGKNKTTFITSSTAKIQ